jgi:Protein of unknown function (DUF3093)
MASKVLFVWEAPEFRHYDKTLVWYVTVILVTAALIFLEIYKNDFFGAVSLFVICLLFVLFAHRKPSLVTIQLTNTGVHMGRIHIPYKEIKKFWVVHTRHHKTLNLETTAYLQDLVVIQLGDQDSEEIREFLNIILPEHETPAPTFIQTIMHKFKF